jgi:predicted transcriptional regulator
LRISLSEKNLPVFEALSSDVRIKIIGMLVNKPMNIKEIAKALGLSSAIITMHVRKLEEAGLIRSERIHSGRSTSKLCYCEMDSIEIIFPSKKNKSSKIHEFALPVGHYTDFDVTPTCGLSTTDHIIGGFDDPRHFLDPERVNAGILWFTKGFVEYRLPNYLLSDQTPVLLEISLELCSEAPGVNDDWPSDISFALNGIEIGKWTSPGDFGGIRGKFTPDWWSLSVGQFGLLKVIRINDTGTYIDDKRISDVTLQQLDLRQKQFTFRISVPSDAVHIGGVTLFGTGFGNYNQDIIFRLYYE